MEHWRAAGYAVASLDYRLVPAVPVAEPAVVAPPVGRNPGRWTREVCVGAANLKRQAKQAERYRKLTEEIKMAEARLIFARWRDAGVWDRVALALAGERDLARVFIDSTIVRAHQHASGAQKK